jgi:hypothetical protein
MKLAVQYLLDGDECLGDMTVLGDEESAEVEGKSLGVEDVWGDLGKVCVRS